MQVEGGCLCGHIEYKAGVDPDKVAICHCTDCQTNSGTAYGVVVAVVNEDFRLLRGELKTYEKIAESGTVRVLAFCPECGTRIYANTPGDRSKYFGLRLGTVRQRDQLKPRVQVWCKSALEWVHDLGHIPQFDGQPTPGEKPKLHDGS